MTGAPESILLTERLAFRPWRPDDLELAVALWGDPEVTRFIGGPLSADAAAARLASEMASQAAAGIQYWPIFRLPSAHRCNLFR